MSEPNNIQLANGFFAAINAHDVDRWCNLLSEDYIADQPGIPGPMNKEQVRGFQQGFLTAFPDIHFDITRTIAEGDYVVMHWTATITHTGPMRTPSGKTIPPTNKKGALSGSSTLETKGGKITHAWVYWDTGSLLSQLGVLPPM